MVLAATPARRPQLSLGNFLSFESGSQCTLGDRSGAVTSDGIFCHVLIEVIQMLRTDIADFQMADGLIDPGQHIQVSVHGAGFNSGAFL